MPPVVTDAIVLHAFDYLETSRILRLATREAGVISVVAKGARRTRARYGSALDLFAEGEAQVYIKQTRDLQTLAAFDVSVSRPTIALDIGRFLAASAIAELMLRLGRGDYNPTLYQTISDTLTGIAAVDKTQVSAQALAGAWRIVAESGFAPTVDMCASCHAPLAPDARVAFSHAAGGALCDRCARLTPTRRVLPADARATLAGWLHSQEPPQALEPVHIRAHQRLFREFLAEHSGDDRPLKAFLTWEQGLPLV
jgi:DNA repair protein RecO (recombination protein O)